MKVSCSTSAESVFETQKRPTGSQGGGTSGARNASARRLPTCPSEDELARELEAGRTGLKHWSIPRSHDALHPTEIDAREVVGEFLFSRLPEGPRRLLIRRRELLATISMTCPPHCSPWHSGTPRVLQSKRIFLGIVSMLMLAWHTAGSLPRRKVDSFFGVQVYSDEVGIRKPHPGMIALAADALGMSITTSAGTWVTRRTGMLPRAGRPALPD